MAKTLVAYFSASGVTKKVAEEIAQLEKADLFEIVPEAPYTAEDLDYTNPQSRCSVEMNDANSRPAMVGRAGDDYDVIYLGFPIWWGREPSIVDTFLDAQKFEGKTIIPFCTSGASPMGNTAERIRNLTGRKNTVFEGKRYGGAVSIEELKKWTDEIDSKFS